VSLIELNERKRDYAIIELFSVITQKGPAQPAGPGGKYIV
jgi:hypothetical protein